jgi:hypothetical protein
MSNMGSVPSGSMGLRLDTFVPPLRTAAVLDRTGVPVQVVDAEVVEVGGVRAVDPEVVRWCLCHTV